MQNIFIKWRTLLLLITAGLLPARSTPAVSMMTNQQLTECISSSTILRNAVACSEALESRGSDVSNGPSPRV